MVGGGLLLIVAAVVCGCVFVGATVRADAQAGAPVRMTRRSWLWLLAAILLVDVGIGFLVVHVVGLWL